MNRSSATDQSIGQTDKREVSATPIPSTDAEQLVKKLLDLADRLPEPWQEDRNYSVSEQTRLLDDIATVRLAAEALRRSPPRKDPPRMTATRVKLGNEAHSVLTEMQQVYGVPRAMIDKLRELDNAWHEAESVVNDIAKPVAWIVHADHPFVTMDPPYEGGLPRTPLFARSETAPRIIGLDWGKPGGDYSAFACSCGDVRTEKDGPCKRKNCPIRSAENSKKP